MSLDQFVRTVLIGILDSLVKTSKAILSNETGVNQEELSFLSILSVPGTQKTNYHGEFRCIGIGSLRDLTYSCCFPDLADAFLAALHNKPKVCIPFRTNLQRALSAKRTTPQVHRSAATISQTFVNQAEIYSRESKCDMLLICRNPDLSNKIFQSFHFCSNTSIFPVCKQFFYDQLNRVKMLNAPLALPASLSATTSVFPLPLSTSVFPLPLSSMLALLPVGDGTAAFPVGDGTAAFPIELLGSESDRPVAPQSRFDISLNDATKHSGLKRLTAIRIVHYLHAKVFSVMAYYLL